MDEVSGKQVTDIFTLWISQEFHPIVRVFRLDTTKYRVLQHTLVNPKIETLWPIPLTYETSNGLKGEILIKEKETEIEIEGLSSDDYTLFNPNLEGFYVVKYE